MVTIEEAERRALPPEGQEAAGGRVASRAGRPGRIGPELAAALLLVVAGLFVLVRAALPSDGTATAPATAVPDGVRVTPLLALPGGLRAGDVVVAVNGHKIASRSLPRVAIGDHLVYQVRRGSSLANVVVTIRRYPIGRALGQHWATLVVFGSLLVVGGYVFARRPDDRAARVLLNMASLAICAATSWVFGLEVVDLGGGAGWWVNLAGGVAYAMVWACMVHFLLLFPTPAALVVRRHRLVGFVYLIPVALYCVHVATVFPRASTPLQRAGVLATTTAGTEYLIPVLLLVGVTAGYLRSDPDGRFRLRSVMSWMAVAVTLDVALWSAPKSLAGHPLIAGRLHPLVYLPVPLAIAAAVLRQRLFDIEVVVRRSLVFAGLTGCLVAIYVVTVGALSRLFQHGHGWAPLVATGMVAVLFAPLHLRLRRAVSRMIYGYRDDPFAIVARLGESLEKLASPDDVLPLVVNTLASTLRLPYAAIELSYHDKIESAAHHGELKGRPLSLPLVFRGERLGRLVVGERTLGEGFSGRESRMLGELARQAGVAAHAVRLTRDLQRSRERLVTAVEEERRRLRRDLHDGAAPTVAAAAKELETVRSLTITDPEAAATLAARVADDVKMAVADIRHVVYDLRPPALDQLGLVPALREQARTLAFSGAPLSVRVEATGDFTDLPAAVEVAAFRIACEAMHNMSRHASAKVCTVHLLIDLALDLEISDDGRGLGAKFRAGAGVASMRERAAELGGNCTIESPPSGGTIVRAHLPLQPR